MKRLITVALAATLAALAAACAVPTTNRGSVSDASAGQPGASTPTHAVEAPTWGKRYTWGDGLALEVVTPIKCTPTKYAMPQNIQRAVKFKITILNGTKQPFDTAVLTFGSDAQFNSSKAEKIFDSNGSCGDGGIDSTTVLPGKTYSYEVGYAVGAQPGEMQLTFEPQLGSDRAVFVGQA